MRLADKLNSYFERPDTPTAASPVGNVMQILVLEYPDEELEHIHELVREAMQGIGGKHRAQDAARKARAALGMPRRALVAHGDSQTGASL